MEKVNDWTMKLVLIGNWMTFSIVQLFFSLENKQRKQNQAVYRIPNFIAKVFSRENKVFVKFAKVFSANYSMFSKHQNAKVFVKNLCFSQHVKVSARESFCF